MTLDATVPADSAFTDTYAENMRETRAAVNDNETSIAAITALAITNDITLTSGQTSLAIGTTTGTDLLDINLEITIISGTDEDIDTISNGQNGMIKYFKANATFTISEAGNIVLKNPDGITTVDLEAGDTIYFYNDGGVQGTGNGIWYELGRSLMP